MKQQDGQSSLCIPLFACYLLHRALLVRNDVLTSEIPIKKETLLVGIKKFESLLIASSPLNSSSNGHYNFICSEWIIISTHTVFKSSLSSEVARMCGTKSPWFFIFSVSLDRRSSCTLGSAGRFFVAEDEDGDCCSSTTTAGDGYSRTASCSTRYCVTSQVILI